MGTKATEYGIRPDFRNLCGGLNWMPQVKAALPSAVGHVTVLVEAWKSSGSAQKERWRNVCNGMFEFLPGSQNVIKYLSDNGNPNGNKRVLLSLMADITVLTGAKNVQKVAPCPLMFAIGRSRSYGGPGAMVQYMYLNQIPVKKRPVYPEISSQILLHAFFDTLRDDFMILQQITSCGSSYTRKEMGHLGMKDKVSNSNFSLIKFKYYSKMRSAMLEESGLKREQAVTMAYPVFSGFSKRRVTENMKRRMKESDTKGIMTDDFQSTCEELRRVLHELYNEYAGKEKHFQYQRFFHQPPLNLRLIKSAYALKIQFWCTPPQVPHSYTSPSHNP